MENALHLALGKIYYDIDKEIALHDVECNACSKCCNFAKFDHILFANSLEVEYIICNLEKPLKGITPGICPFQQNGKCSIRKYRTLGCRVFYCDKSYDKNLSQDIYNKYYGKIKELTLKHKKEWSYKPFLEYLDEYAINSNYLAKSNNRPLNPLFLEGLVHY